MSTLETLLEAMHLPSDSELPGWMLDRGVALADEETMSQAIHEVYAASRPTMTDRTRRTTRKRWR